MLSGVACEAALYFSLSNFWQEVNPMVEPNKTHKGLSKRFKVTAKGKVKHRKAFRGHILGKKSGNKKRHLRQDGVLTGTNAKKIAAALAPGV
jgi:large subunit ribosomal protein L35